MIPLAFGRRPITRRDIREAAARAERDRRIAEVVAALKPGEWTSTREVALRLGIDGIKTADRLKDALDAGKVSRRWTRRYEWARVETQQPREGA